VVILTTFKTTDSCSSEKKTMCGITKINGILINGAMPATLLKHLKENRRRKKFPESLVLFLVQNRIE
jgi:hypothetical protein